MSSIWVVLLDVSGSMDNGFSGPASTDPLAERGRWHTKLEAAKELLLRRVAASQVQDVAVITFSDTAKKIYHGTRRDFPQAEATIRALKTEDMTNLANGFLAVTSDPAFEGYNALSVLILSDGLSNQDDPVARAEELIGKYPFARIDTILIDETPEGRRIAEAVSINGAVTPAYSVLDLGRALDSARASSLRQELTGLAERRLGLESEIATIMYAAPPVLLRATSETELTPASLREEVVPTLEGLEWLERGVRDATGQEYAPRITSISQDSPISISLSGFKEAIELALEWVIPWRRKNAELLAHLKLRQTEIEIEKATIQNREAEVALARSKIELAEKMLALYDPDHTLSSRRRQRLLHQFITGIDHMSRSVMEFKAISPSSEDDNVQPIH
ncbi:MAG TPA: vWA domain-containing protein [Candidatus Angelobacter sp.]